MLTKVALVVAIVALSYVQIGDAIRCWSCNSETFNKCSDPFNASEYSPRIRSLLIECVTQSYTNIQQSLHGMRWVCKKSQLKSPHGRLITTRGCHYTSIDAPTGDCTDSITRNIHMQAEFCETCDNENGCNGASSIRNSAVFMALLSLFSFFLCFI